MWNVRKIVSKGDYNYAVVPEHPKCTKHGYVLEHRIVVENHLGRLLTPYEVVHHKNENKKDNRLDNLEVKSKSNHSKEHLLERGSKFVVLKCPCCSLIFERRLGNTFLVKKSRYTCCSNRCRGKLSRSIQMHGITHEVEQAITENIVREYVKYSTDNPVQTANNRMRRDYTPVTCNGEDIVQPTTAEAGLSNKE